MSLLCYPDYVLIKALYILLVLSVVAVVGVCIAGYIRVRRHLRKPHDQAAAGVPPHLTGDTHDRDGNPDR